MLDGEGLAERAREVAQVEDRRQPAPLGAVEAGVPAPPAPSSLGPQEEELAAGVGVGVSVARAVDDNAHVAAGGHAAGEDDALHVEGHFLPEAQQYGGC